MLPPRVELTTFAICKRYRKNPIVQTITLTCLSIVGPWYDVGHIGITIYQRHHMIKSDNPWQNHRVAYTAQVSKSLPSTAVPSAFNESAPVRLIYLHAVKNNIFYNHTEDDCTRQALDVLEVAGLLPLYPIPARTLVTAKRRLGIDVDKYIIKQPICTVCFKNYSAEEIEALENENCTVRRCKGIVYHTKRTAGPANTEATTKRVPAKIQPYAVMRKHGLHLGSPIQTRTDGMASCSMVRYPVLFKSGSTSNYGNAPQIKYQNTMEPDAWGTARRLTNW